GVDYYGKELELCTKSGERRTVLWSNISEGFPISGWAGWGIGVDISDRKRAADALVRAERLKAVADLAAGVAHNFNNLLQIVVGGTHLALAHLDMTNLTQVRSNLKQVLESSRFGAETVKRLQDFARLRDDKIVKGGKVFDLSSTVDQAVEMSKPWWKTGPEREGLEIKVHRNLQKGCLVEGREGEIFEVVLNLIKNAVEALPGSGGIAVRSFVSQGNVFVQVSDDGPGIPEPNLGRIFEPFFTTKGFNGTGMGLAGSYGIVVRHGGRIGVESAEGKGATFTVELPLSREEAPPVTDGVFRFPWRLRILVVDDAAPIVRMLSESLKKHSQTVFSATSGQEAIEIVYRNDIDVVICDLAMPGMNGWQVGKAVKEICQERGLPKSLFVILTGWTGQGSEEEKMDESGVDAIVQKPIEGTKLLERIGHLMEERGVAP
ncbi:MAG: ATP-binding protein, partial [Pseudomonadota bacterium]